MKKRMVALSGIAGLSGTTTAVVVRVDASHNLRPPTSAPPAGGAENVPVID
jgi:hypothetical protein